MMQKMEHCYAHDIPYNIEKSKEYVVDKSESTITAKGQTTVPAPIREMLGAGPGTRLVWYVMPDGRLIVRAKTKPLSELAGSLTPPTGREVTVEDMNAWRD